MSESSVLCPGRPTLLFGPGSPVSPIRFLSGTCRFIQFVCSSSTDRRASHMILAFSGQGLSRQLSAGSSAFADFPADFFTTIPCSDFSLPVVPARPSTALHGGYRPNGAETLRSPWVTSSLFPPKPVLLTCEFLSGMGRSLLLQGYPNSPANLVNRLFRSLPSGPPHSSSRTLHCLSATHFRHSSACQGLTPIRAMRCQAHKKPPPKGDGLVPSDVLLLQGEAPDYHRR